jgi:2'-5' RNA ligase
MINSRQRGDGMRVFIAIELEDWLKEYIYEKQKDIKRNSIKGNFSRKENFHLTLRFIGEADEEEIERIKKAIDRTAETSKPFNMQLGKLGYFPRKNKKIVWAGISNGQKKLRNLFDILEINLEKQGFDREERGLKPHITIARQVRLKIDFDNLAEKINIESLNIPVEKISLMESTRVNGKLTYRPIYVKEINTGS